MFIDCYQVEEESLITYEGWKTLEVFRLKYKWAYVVRLFCFLFRRPRPEITGSKMIQAVIVKIRAYDYARRAMRDRRPRSIRITRLEREGARLVKTVIWLDGKWVE